jgi:ferredoxin-NADP reductase
MEVAEDLIRFRVPRPINFYFESGQSVKVGLGDLQRAYSIVSAPHEPFLEFFVELAPGGRMSERLRQIQVGDHLTLGSAKGGFQFDEACPEQVMIATVTGINPFISMLRDYLHHRRSDHRFHILHGASYQGEFGYRDELASLAASDPDRVRYIPTVSRPDEPANASWSGQTGRVDTIVDDYLKTNGLEPATTRIYACGNSGMLDVVAPRYQAAGFRVLTESYD